MNKRQIQENIEKALTLWFKSLPANLKAAAKRDVIVSGGCIASMLLNEPVRDYDLYFKEVNTAYLLAKHYTAHLGYNAVDAPSLNRVTLNQGVIKLGRAIPISSELYSPVHYSQNAITLTGGLQIILRFCGKVDSIHKTFDFAHTRSYYTVDEGLILTQKSLESIVTKELVYAGSGFPVAALSRAMKFTKRGWKLPASELIKIVYDIAKLDISNPEVLKEQLGGYYGNRLAKQMDSSGRQLAREDFFHILEKYAPKSDASLGNYK
jgi:hypothetical protein